MCHNAAEGLYSAHISYTVLFAFGGRSLKVVQNLCLSRLFTVYIMLRNIAHPTDHRRQGLISFTLEHPGLPPSQKSPATFLAVYEEPQ